MINDRPISRPGTRVGSQSASLVRPRLVDQRPTTSFGLTDTKAKSHHSNKSSNNSENNDIPIKYERKVKSAMSMRHFEDNVQPIESKLQRPEPKETASKSVAQTDPKKAKESDRESIVSVYKIYLDICAQRDSIPERSKSRIDLLKRKDAIFAKRYKQFITAKNSNKAPKFDLNDLYAPIIMPKSVMIRKKEEIIKEANDDREKSAKKYRTEMQLIEKKIKKFIQEISSF